MKIGFLLFRGLVRRRPLRLFFIALCAFGCFLCYIGLGCSFDSISASRDFFVQQTGLGDLTVCTEEVPEGALKALLLETEGIEAAEEGLLYTVRCTCADSAVRTVRFFSYAEESLVSPILKGTGDFALSYGYTVDFPAEGVSLLTLPDGETVSVSAVAFLPAYTAVYADRHTVSADGEIVDVYTDFERLKALSGSGCVNRAVAVLKEDADREAVLAALRENDDIFIEYAIPAEEDAPYAASSELSEIILSVCRLFPWILFGVGLLFICIFLSGVADRSRLSAGTLLCDGASPSELFCGLFLFGLFAVLLGFLLSIPFSLLLAHSITTLSLKNMGTPFSGLSFPVFYLIYSLGVCFLLSLIAASAGVFFLCRRRLPELLRRVRSRRAGKAADLLLTALCTAAAMALVMTTLIYKDSLSAVRDSLFFERYSYDAQVVYSGFVPLSRLEELKSSGAVLRCEPLLLGNATLSAEKNSLEVLGLGLSEEGELLSFFAQDGAPVKAVENGIVLSQSTAERLGVEEGDLVTAEVTYGGKRIEIFCAVGGISRQFSSFTELFSLHTAEEYLDSSGVMNSAAVKIAEGKTAEFLRYAEKLDDVYSIERKENALSRFDNRFSGTKRLIDLIAADGVLLGFSICLLMGYGAWRRNLKRNSILIMLGESPLLLAAQDGLLRLCGVLLGLAAGIPVNILGGQAILRFLSNDTVCYPFLLRADTLLLGGGLALSYAFICALLYFAATALRARDFI